MKKRDPCYITIDPVTIDLNIQCLNIFDANGN